MLLVGILYIIQLFGAVLSITAFSSLVILDATGISYFDFGLLTGNAIGLFALASGMLLIAFVFSFFIALFFLIKEGFHILVGLSLLISPVCLCLYLIPGFNLIPWVWVWAFYVVKNQNTN